MRQSLARQSLANDCILNILKLKTKKDVILSDSENSRDVEKRSQERRERSS